MKQQEVKEIVACLKGGRTLFHYFKDRYCIELLGLMMQTKGKSSMSIAELKQSELRGLLHKPILQQGISHCSDAYLTQDDLPLFWPTQTLAFVLTLASWGAGYRGWDQTSRNQSNLVLQLNFCGQHDDAYQKLVKAKPNSGPFKYRGHPVSRRYNTMSWVRMDVDFVHNEVLIEEIQNDWLRLAAADMKRLLLRRKRFPRIKPSHINADVSADFDAFYHYVEHVLAPYRQLWAEASLLAALLFIKLELGINQVYYHSFDTGKKIKQVPGSPPRSLYTKLPKKFGFKLSEQAPQMLLQHKFAKRCIRAIEKPQWFQLAI